jgi:hypothetical protein
MKEILKLPPNLDRRYKQAFLWGIERFGFGQKDFHNHEYRSEYCIYLQNLEKYAGLREGTLGDYEKLKSIQLAVDITQDEQFN